MTPVLEQFFAASRDIVWDGVGHSSMWWFMLSCMHWCGRLMQSQAWWLEIQSFLQMLTWHHQHMVGVQLSALALAWGSSPFRAGSILGVGPGMPVHPHWSQ